MKRATQSIRRMLLVSLLGILSVLMALAAGFSYHAGLQEAGEMFDARLVQSARVLSNLMDEPLGDVADHPGEAIVLRGWHGHATGVGEALAFDDGHAYETKLAFQVWDAAGMLLLRSDSAPTVPFAPLRAGYANVEVAGERWRVFTLRSPQGRWFQSAERADIREELAGDIAEGTLLPLLLALPLMAVLTWLAVRWATRALVQLSGQIGERDPQNMTPLAPGNLPKEVQGLVGALNALLLRLDEALARERRFIADAAHELRTPISALKVHVGNVRLARGEDEREESQRHLDASVVRVERLVSQLLSLSRAEHAHSASRMSTLDLDALVRIELEDIRALARSKQQTLATSFDQVKVVGDELGLSLLVRSLIENAVRYAPQGGCIVASTQHTCDGVMLCVADSGPGIAPEAHARVFLRFHRELGSGVEGSGLGLAIADEVVRAHRGRIELGTSGTLGGLEVRVHLPASQRAIAD